MRAGGKNQFQKEPGLNGLQPAFYKGRPFSFGTDLRARFLPSQCCIGSVGSNLGLAPVPDTGTYLHR